MAGGEMSSSGLTVALDCGAWSCELVPAAEYRSPTSVPLRLITGDELKALENDRRTFARYFRPGYDFRRTITTDIDAIRSFVRDHLNVAHWNQPTDNAGIERILKHAVADGRLVPVIDRDRFVPVRTRQAPHAPQHWGETYWTGGGAVAASPRGKTFHQSVMESMGLDVEGATAYIEKYNAMVERMDAIRAASVAKRAVASSGDDFPGMVETAAGAALGNGDESGDVFDDGGGVFDEAVSGDDAVDVSTPLGDAQPFAYMPDALSDDVTEFAARGGSEANEVECFTQYERELDLCRALGGPMGGLRGKALCEQNAFDRYQQCRGY